MLSQNLRYDCLTPEIAGGTLPSLTVDEPMSARIPRDNGISGTFLIVLKTLYAGATSKVF